MNAYYEIGATDKARELASQISYQYSQRADLYSSIPEESLMAYSRQLQALVAEYEGFVRSIQTNDSTSFGWEIDSIFKQAVSPFQMNESQYQE